MFLDAQFYAEYGSSATGIEWVKYGTMGMSKPSAELCYNDAMLSDLAVCDAVLEEMNWVFTSFTLVEIVNIVDRMGRTASPYSAKTAYAFDGSNVGHKLAKEALESEAEHRWLAAMLSA
jgi:hypothetical protein